MYWITAACTIRFRPPQRQAQQGLWQLVEQHGPQQLDALPDVLQIAAMLQQERP